MVDKKKNILDLPPGRYPVKIKSLRLTIKKGGAGQIRLLLESEDENIEGTFTWDTPLFSF